MADRLRGGECKRHDTAEQVLLAFYTQLLGSIRPDQRVVRYEIQSARVMVRTVEFFGETVAFGCSEHACEFAEGHALVVASGTTRIGDHRASRFRLLRHRRAFSVYVYRSQEAY